MVGEFSPIETFWRSPFAKNERDVLLLLNDGMIIVGAHYPEMVAMEDALDFSSYGGNGPEFSRAAVKGWQSLDVISKS